MRGKGCCYGADPGHVRKSGAPPSGINSSTLWLAPCRHRPSTSARPTSDMLPPDPPCHHHRGLKNAKAQRDANAAASALFRFWLTNWVGLPCEAIPYVFLPEVRECIARHTAYNKHDTGWAKGAPSEDHTTPPSSRTASGGRIVGGAPAGARPFWGWLIPRVPYSDLVPYWEQTAVPATGTRPREGDVCYRISSYRAAVCARIRRFN